jgi:hypothetical protein
VLTDVDNSNIAAAAATDNASYQLPGARTRRAGPRTAVHESNESQHRTPPTCLLRCLCGEASETHGRPAIKPRSDRDFLGVVVLIALYLRCT